MSEMEPVPELPHPWEVIPGSARDVIENGPVPPLPPPPGHWGAYDHEGVAAELEARMRLPETHPDLMG